MFLKKSRDRRETRRLMPVEHRVMKERILRASSGFPSPSFLETMAAAPVPNMVPSPTIKLRRGYTMLIAEKALVFTSRATNRPSTMV